MKIRPATVEFDSEREFADCCAHYLDRLGWKIDRERAVSGGVVDILATLGGFMMLVEVKLKACDWQAALGQLQRYRSAFASPILCFACPNPDHLTASDRDALAQAAVVLFPIDQMQQQILSPGRVFSASENGAIKVSASVAASESLMDLLRQDNKMLDRRTVRSLLMARLQLAKPPTLTMIDSAANRAGLGKEANILASQYHLLEPEFIKVLDFWASRNPNHKDKYAYVVPLEHP